ncbi:MAG: phosphoribosyltransferase family protein [Deltaproteobacteria bacterium]|nr:phosphoribosyltransferase family protein [Deltaproteobacteria bacterium]
MTLPPEFTLYLPRGRIERRVAEMAAAIEAGFEPERTLLVGILGGAVFFMTELAAHLDPDYTMDFLALSSYGDGETSSGRVRLDKDVQADCEGKTALILDDILDTGRTLAYAVAHLTAKGAARVKGVVLLAKTHDEKTAALVDAVGFSVPEGFYIGYGLDLAGRYRGLRDIYRKDWSHA